MVLGGAMPAPPPPPPPPPANGCKVEQMAVLPVTMVGRRAMVAAKFGDRDARFILDSGAFYSTISRAAATEYGLRVDLLPLGFYVKGIGGESSAGYTVTNSFSLAGLKVPKVDFVVGGTDTGQTGLLGQNILGLADIEYDFPHGMVRLMKTTRCGHVGLAYWAQDKPVTMLPLIGEPESRFHPHTLATVLVNGVKVTAMFDSGAVSSLMTLAAAKRAGVTPASPGVEPDGYSTGLGSHHVSTWLATFDKIDVGGEAISHPRIRIGDTELGNADMLIGADFFLTHRLFVSNANHVMFVTYEGGPVFGLSPKHAYTSDGKLMDLTDKAADPKTAEEFSRRGAALMSNHRLTDALADFDKAIAMAPGEGRYYYQRATAHLANRQRDEGLTDLDKAIALMPGDVDARFTRAGIRLRARDRDGALADVKAADGVLAPSSDRRFALAAMYDELGQPEPALTNYDLWLKGHPEDAGRMAALNGRCWARGQLNRELDKALADCNAAVRMAPKNAAFLDSRALIRLRRGELALALADYDAALAANPREAWSLYARGITEAKLGQADKAKADRAAALAINPTLSERARRFGLEP
ncbi:MAG: aspartyl protease family protein [Sphingomonas sp.]|nr:aspartyl protease family protein [Sphingomonas sp.]